MLAVSVPMLMKLRAIRACDDAYDPRDACRTVRHGDGRHDGHAIPDDRGTRTHENLVFFYVPSKILPSRQWKYKRKWYFVLFQNRIRNFLWIYADSYPQP